MKDFILRPLSEEELDALARRRASRKNRGIWKMIIRPLIVTTALFAISQAVIMEALIQKNEPDPKEVFPVEEAIQLCQDGAQGMAIKTLDFGNPFFRKKIGDDQEFDGWNVEIPLWNQQGSQPAVAICSTDKHGEGLYYLRTQGLDQEILKSEFPPLLVKRN